MNRPKMPLPSRDAEEPKSRPPPPRPAHERKGARDAAPCAILDGDIVACLVARGVIGSAAVARAREAAPGLSCDCLCALPQLDALIRDGAVKIREVLALMIERQGVVDYVTTRSEVPFSARMFRLVPRELAARIPAFPTFALTPEGPVLILAPRTLSRAEQQRLTECFERPVAALTLPEPEVRRALEEANEWCASNGFRGARLGDILVRDGIVSPEAVAVARTTARERHVRLGEALMETGAVDEATLYRLLSGQRAMSLVTANEVLSRLEPSLVRRLPLAFLRHNLVVPYRYEGTAIRAAVTDPLYSADGLAEQLRAEVRLDLISPSEMKRVLNTLGGGGAEEVVERSEPALETAAPDTALVADRHRYEEIADRLLSAAIRENASDIHLEVYDNEVVVRLRIDGVMCDYREVPLTKTDLRGVVNVVKIRANMDIAEHRLPQSGRMRRRTMDGGIYDFRVQTQPALHGEHLVIRLLSQTAPLLPLEELGFNAAVRASMLRLIASTGGLIIIAGPTGSGKTTTLYSLLDRLRSSRQLKIVTAEDPIEYALPGVQQSQIHPDIGYTFASATRAFLREDPDVILVGETRDLETAIETIRASQTGHLVLTTLHANDAISSVRRVLDLGVDPASLASELAAVVGQRLVRKSCDACRMEYTPSPDAMAELWPSGPPSGLVFTRGGGCARCRGTGYRGRVVVAELWEAVDEVRDAIGRDAPPEQLRQLAQTSGVLTMVDVACDKIAVGATTVEEVVATLPYASLRRHRQRLLGKPK